MPLPLDCRALAVDDHIVHCFRDSVKDEGGYRFFDEPLGIASKALDRTAVVGKKQDKVGRWQLAKMPTYSTTIFQSLSNFEIRQDVTAQAMLWPMIHRLYLEQYTVQVSLSRLDLLHSLLIR